MTSRRGRVHQLPVWLAVILVAVGAVVAGPHQVAARADVVVAPNPDPGLIARWEPCQPGGGVTMIIDFQSLGDGKIYVGCAAGPQPNGLAALRAAGFATTGTVQYHDQVVCKIDGLPNPAPPDDCKSMPGAFAYWSYWLADTAGGSWGYSGWGATSPAGNGDDWPIQGWSFGAGAMPRIAPMDATGPHETVLVPEPTSAQASSLTQQWLTTQLNDESPAWSSQSVIQGTPLVASLLESGVSPASLAPTLDRLRDNIEQLSTQTQGSGGARVRSRNASAHLVLSLAAAHDPQDDQVIAFLAQELLGMIGDDASGYRGWFGQWRMEGTPETGLQPRLYFTKEASNQARVIEALIAAGVPVPLSAVDALWSYECPNTQGGGDGTNCLTRFVNHDVVRALVALREAGDDAVSGGTLDRAAVEQAITRIGDRALARQLPDGTVLYERFARPFAHDAAQVAFALSAAGQLGPARLSSRWVATQQVTPGTAGSGPATSDIGYVPNNVDTLRQFLINGRESSWAATLVQWDLRTAAYALDAWRAAPYVDPVLGAAVADDVTPTSATIALPVTAGSEDVTVSVTYGTSASLATATRTVTGGTVSAGDSSTVITRLDDLRPDRVYYARTIVSGDGLAVSEGPILAFSTLPAPVLPDPPGDAGTGQQPATTTLVVKADRRRVGAGALVRITGRTDPAAGGTVRLELLKGKKGWRSLEVTTLKNGACVFKVRRGKPGTYRLRVVYLGDVAHQPATSPTVKVRVRR